MRKSALGGRDIFRFAFPGRLRCVLKRATVRERQLPGQIADLVHGVEMGGRLFVALSAGQEGDPGYGSRHAQLEHGYGFLGNFLDRRALGALFPGDDHVRFEHDAFKLHARVEQLIEHCVQARSVTVKHRSMS